MRLLNKLKQQRIMRERLDGERRTRLYRIAYAWCHEPALADDLVQETLGKALARADQLRDPAALDAWLLRILTNCWRDHFRGQRDTVDIDEMELADETTADGSYEQQEIVERVRASIAQLPIGQRQVLTLVDLEGSSYAEVADILDIPIGTVMSRLCRARQSLKARLLTADNPVRLLPDGQDTVITFRRKP